MIHAGLLSPLAVYSATCVGQHVFFIEYFAASCFYVPQRKKEGDHFSKEAGEETTSSLKDQVHSNYVVS
jgi:hypothetical protein